MAKVPMMVTTALMIWDHGFHVVGHAGEEIAHGEAVQIGHGEALNFFGKFFSQGKDGFLGDLH